MGGGVRVLRWEGQPGRMGPLIISMEFRGDLVNWGGDRRVCSFGLVADQSRATGPVDWKA